MKKLSRALSAVLALALMLSLAACGSDAPKEVDINALAEELLGSASFGEELTKLDESVALGLYGCAEGAQAVAYAGTGATAEELAVFNCGSAEAAETLAANLETRNQTRIGQYESYDPEEVPKLENALIMSGGQYVVLCVASDLGSAASVAENALK